MRNGAGVHEAVQASIFDAWTAGSRPVVASLMEAKHGGETYRVHIEKRIRADNVILV